MRDATENDPRQKPPVPWFDLICVGVAMLALAAGRLCNADGRKDESGQEASGVGGGNRGGGGSGHDRGRVPLPHLEAGVTGKTDN
jgi:hypothetical protein